MKHKIKKANNCLLCKNKRLKKIFSLGNLYVSNFVNKNKIQKGIRSPLTLMYCSNCTLIQLSHLAPQEIMYKRFYWYKSGVTKIMRNALKDIYKSCIKYTNLKKNDVVLDIGANDGTLLKYFKQNVKTVGCEPANNLVGKLKKNCDYVLNDFWSINKFEKLSDKYKLTKPKIITAIGMFYDLEDPNKFIRDSVLALDDNGIFVAQLMCLKSMIEKNDIGNICHEHIEFYSLNSLKYLFENNGLEIFKIEENDINGGSYRIFCRKYINGSIKLPRENILTSIKNFVKRAQKNKKETMKFINRQLKNKKKNFFIWGVYKRKHSASIL